MIPYDKLGHYFVGQIIALCLIPFFSMYFVMCVVLLSGLTKEIYDTFNNGGVEWQDLLFTVAGAATLYLVRCI
jgi:hypothetical protein